MGGAGVAQRRLPGALAIRGASAGATRPCSECLDHLGKVRGKGCVNAEIRALRPAETHAVRVQEHAPEAERAQLLVEGRIAVLVIPRNGMSGVRGMYPGLVGATGAQRHLHEGRGTTE